MASTVETGTFKHEELPDARTYIKLLEVLSVERLWGVPVHCRLTTCPKASAPGYTALSCTWGDPSAVTTILVNGKRMQVRRNCKDVLLHPCRKKGGYIWIDAICINQADNDDKSFQVANMGEIFEDASQTLVCVGRQKNDSQFLFRTLQGHQYWWERFSFNGLGPPEKQHDRAPLWRKSLPESTMNRLFEALYVFLKRPYFQRVWIHQELFFGKDIQVCCEDKSAELVVLWELVYNTVIPDWLWYCHSNLWRCRRKARAEMRGVLFLLAAEAGQPRRNSLWMTIGTIGRLQSEDPRDRIFGTLAMIVCEEGEQLIRPDYGEDLFDLAIEVVRRLSPCGRSWSNVHNVAKDLGLPDRPSSRLAEEVQRQCSKHMEASPLDSTIVVSKADTEVKDFWGTRVHFHDGCWRTQRGLSEAVVDSSGSGSPISKNLLNGVSSPNIQKWSKVHSWDVLNTDIILPEEVESQDWLLVPISENSSFIPFIAKDTGNSRLELVGKAFLRPLVLERRGGEAFEFKLHLDLVNIIILSYSRGWQSWAPDQRLELHGPDHGPQHGPQPDEVDNYFDTRLCGQGSCSYATVERVEVSKML